MTINGRLVDEPPFEFEAPDPAVNNWTTTWTGPEDGWYSVAAHIRYKRLCAEAGDYEEPIDEPTALPGCTVVSLLEVAAALPAVMAAWHIQKHAEMDAQSNDLLSRSVLLREQISTVQLSA